MECLFSYSLHIPNLLLIFPIQWQLVASSTIDSIPVQCSWVGRDRPIRLPLIPLSGWRQLSEHAATAFENDQDTIFYFLFSILSTQIIRKSNSRRAYIRVQGSFRSVDAAIVRFRTDASCHPAKTDTIQLFWSIHMQINILEKYYLHW